jgi:hypothetical protein
LAASPTVLPRIVTATPASRTATAIGSTLAARTATAVGSTLLQRTA